MIESFVQVSERIVKLRLKARCFNVTLINVYAPVEVAIVEEKMSFVTFYRECMTALEIMP